MFWHPDMYREYLTEDQAIFVAKTDNLKLAEEGIVVYGNADIEGRLVEFSTEQKKTDTHVGVILGVETMGSFAPSKAPVHIAGPTEAERNRALAETIRMLRIDNDRMKRGR